MMDSGMQTDLVQAAGEFLKNIGLLPLYVETNAEGLTRYLCWRAPKDWGVKCAAAVVSSSL